MSVHRIGSKEIHLQFLIRAGTGMQKSELNTEPSSTIDSISELSISKDSGDGQSSTDARSSQAAT